MPLGVRDALRKRLERAVKLGRAAADFRVDGTNAIAVRVVLVTGHGVAAFQVLYFLRQVPLRGWCARGAVIIGKPALAQSRFTITGGDPQVGDPVHNPLLRIDGKLTIKKRIISDGVRI